jgi:hypothetical protein
MTIDRIVIMSDHVSPDRVVTLAAAARVPLAPDDAARIARAVSPTAARLAAAKLELPIETEPGTFVVIQRREIGR